MSDAELSALRNDAIGFVFQEFQLLDHIRQGKHRATVSFFRNRQSVSMMYGSSRWLAN